MLDDSDFHNTLRSALVNHRMFTEGKYGVKKLIILPPQTPKELTQVVHLFSQWALEQEEEE